MAEFPGRAWIHIWREGSALCGIRTPMALIHYRWVSLERLSHFCPTCVEVFRSSPTVPAPPS